jgi:hypothetical protein
VTHACNPSYSGGRDQEDHSLKPAPGKQFVRSYLKKPFHTPPKNRAGGVAQDEGPEFKPQYPPPQQPPQNFISVLVKFNFLLILNVFHFNIFLI